MMNSMKKLVAIALGALCLMCASCTKEEMGDNLNYLWEGTFYTDAINGATGESVTVKKYIYLYFENGGDKCSINFGGAGLGDIRHIYEARWNGTSSFDLYPTTGEQITKEYTGTISGKKMTLHALKGGSITTTYKLTRTNDEQD